MTNKSSSSRLDWIDFARALGIFLVILGHSEIPNELEQRIYMFHMPLFFIISGLLWNVDRNKKLGFGEFAKKKIKAYVIPYFKIAFVCLLIRGVLFNALTMEPSIFWDTFQRYIYGIFVLSYGNVDYLPSCSPIWFLTCLFCAEILFYWIMKHRKPSIFIISCLVVSFFINGKFRLFWNIDTAISVIPFMYFGVIIRRWMEKDYEKKLKLAIILILCSISCLSLAVCNWETSFAGNSYSNLPLTYLFSALVSITILAICKVFVSTCESRFRFAWGRLSENFETATL